MFGQRAGWVRTEQTSALFLDLQPQAFGSGSPGQIWGTGDFGGVLGAVDELLTNGGKGSGENVHVVLPTYLQLKGLLSDMAGTYRTGWDQAWAAGAGSADSTVPAAARSAGVTVP